MKDKSYVRINVFQSIKFSNEKFRGITNIVLPTYYIRCEISRFYDSCQVT